MDYKEKVLVFVDLGFKELITKTFSHGKTNKKYFNKVIFIYQKISELFALNKEHFHLYNKSISQFSDSVVVSYDYRIPETLLFLIESLHQLQVILINLGVVSRGAVVIDQIFHSNFSLSNGKESIYNILFGPAIISAYKLESQKAIYPRILLENNVINFLRNIDFSIIPREMYKKEDFEKVIVKDTDGLYYLDYITAPETFFLPEKININLFKQNLNLLIKNGLKHSDEKVKKKHEWLENKFK